MNAYQKKYLKHNISAMYTDVPVYSSLSLSGGCSNNINYELMHTFAAHAVHTQTQSIISLINLFPAYVSSNKYGC